MKAVVQWYNEFKGFGVAEMSDGVTVFLHRSNLLNVNTLQDGSEIVFDLYEKKQKNGQITFEARNIEEI